MSLDSAHAPLLSSAGSSSGGVSGDGGAPAAEYADPPGSLPWGVLTAVAVTALGPVSFGYVLGYTSPAAQPLLDSGLLTPQQLSVFESLSPLGAIAGASVAGLAADALGRTRALALSCVPFAVGWVAIAAAQARVRAARAPRAWVFRALKPNSTAPRRRTSPGCMLAAC